MEVSVQLKWHKGAQAQQVLHFDRSRGVIPEEDGAGVRRLVRHTGHLRGVLFLLFDEQGALFLSSALQGDLTLLTAIRMAAIRMAEE